MLGIRGQEQVRGKLGLGPRHLVLQARSMRL
jgi:hypothetical protein